MSGIHLRSNTLLLWFSLSVAVAASALVSVGCSSSDEPSTAGAAGKGGGGRSSGGATSTAGSGDSEAGEAAVGGETGETGETGGTGSDPTPSGGSASAGKGGTSAGGSPSTEPDAGEPGEGGAGGSGDAVDPEVAAAQERATALIAGLGDTRKCTACHDVTYKGAGFYPNITPDVETGIGSWDTDAIKAAIRDGKDKDGKTLCATMERYTFTDAELSDIVVLLTHLTPVHNKISAKCPGTGS